MVGSLYRHAYPAQMAQPAIDGHAQDYKAPILSAGEYVADNPGLSLEATGPNVGFPTFSPNGYVYRFGEGNKWENLPGTFPAAEPDNVGPTPVSGCMLSPFLACANSLVRPSVPGQGWEDFANAFLAVQRPAPDLMATIQQPDIPTFWYTPSSNPRVPGFEYQTTSSNLAANKILSGVHLYDFVFASPKVTSNNPSGLYYDSLSVYSKNHNGPYALTQFGTGADKVQFRLVSACLRAKYTGTEDERGGMVSVLEHPEHGSLVGFTLPQMQQYDYCRTEAVMANKWHTCNYSGPINDAEATFSGTPTGLPFMAIVISGGNNLSFQVEGWANYEFAGDPVRDKITVCMDEAGGVAVAAAAKNLQSTKRFGEGSAKRLVTTAHSMISQLSGVS